MSPKKFLKAKLNTSTDHLIIFVIINLGMAIMSIILGISTYKNDLATRQQRLEQQAIKAESITETISEHAWQIRSLANKISTSQPIQSKS